MFRLEPLPIPFTDEVACDVNAFENTLMAELDPETPPYPVALTKAYAVHHDPDEDMQAVAVRTDDGATVAVGWMSANRRENTHLAFMRCGVAASHRRRGVATTLLAAYVDFARSYNRTTLLLGADAYHDDAQGFAASLGATVGMAAHINKLDLRDLPDGLVQQWLSDASPDYELDWVPDSDRPEEWLDDLATVTDVLVNDAPMEGIPVEPRRTSHEQLRAQSERSRALQREWWTLVVRHKATGEPVGYSEMFFPRENPRLGSQGATAVSAKHRGHALGRWLKAAMLERVMRDRPEVDHIRTFNADSNDPMLTINRAMGFKPHLAAARWMIERDAAEAWLEKRT